MNDKLDISKEERRREDVRRELGRIIAATREIKAVSGGWFVKAGNGLFSHFVRKEARRMTCSCLDFEARNSACKHVYAVLARTGGLDQTSQPPPKAPITRKTYGQNWHVYNCAQMQERVLFLPLLRDLCNLIPDETHDEPRRGRPSIPLRDAIIAAACKVQSDVSGRRAMKEVWEAERDGYISRAPSYSHTLSRIQSEAVTPILEKLVEASTIPIRAIERCFAVDATGFGTTRYYRHFSEKRDRNYDRKDNIKLHVAVGVSTHAIAAVSVTPGTVHDSKEFASLVEQVADRFPMEVVCADKGYVSKDAYTLVDRLNASAYIMFKSNSQPDPECPAWTKMFHLCSLSRPQFNRQYHLRSNVESAFSSMKRLFQDFVRAKSFPAQKNELLLKVLAYNIGKVTKAMFELGVEPGFFSAGGDSSSPGFGRSGDRLF